MSNRIKNAPVARLGYASAFVSLGHPVIPLAVNDKIPLECDWPNKGITDPVELVRYWRANMRHNFGVLTGPASGLFVLDVDGEVGIKTLAELEARHGPL